MADRQYKIIIAEDDSDIVELLSLYLKSEGYEIITADNGKSAFSLIEKEKPDLGIFDIMMPEMNGYELIQKTREIVNMPIIVLSAKTSDQEKILGLDLGADDYIPKPFNPLEVTARVRSALRRFYDLNPSYDEKKDSDTLEAGPITVDLPSMSVTKDDEKISLTSTEFKILALLMKHPGRIFTKKQIIENVNESYVESDINSVRVHISNLRDKLGQDSGSKDSCIQTVRGLGYKFVVPERDS